MDFYQFINSKDIREYLIKNKYEFSSLEKAFIVFQSYLPLKKKLKAYSEIIANSEDVPFIREDEGINYPSLKEYLKDYIIYMDKVLNEFAINNDDAIYTYEYFFYRPNGREWTPSTFFSKNLEEIKRYINEVKNKPMYRESGFMIKKVYLEEEYKEISIIYNHDNEIISFDCPMDDEEATLCYALNNLWFDIPTPFKKGDIIIFRQNPYLPNKPVTPKVLTSISSWSLEKMKKDGFIEADFNDDNYLTELNDMKENGYVNQMTASYYFVGDDFGLYRDLDCNYLDVEYYQGKIQNEDRLLNALSMYIKGELYLDEFLQALSIIKKEKQVQREIADFDTIDAILNRLMIKKGED